MAAQRDADARDERLAELIEEFQTRRDRQIEAIAALEAVTTAARERVDEGRRLHDEAVRHLERLKPASPTRRTAYRKAPR